MGRFGETVTLKTDFEMPPGGLNLRWPDDRFEQDRRLQDYKGFAAIAFARAATFQRHAALLTQRSRLAARAAQGAHEHLLDARSGVAGIHQERARARASRRYHEP